MPFLTLAPGHPPAASRRFLPHRTGGYGARPSEPLSWSLMLLTNLPSWLSGSCSRCPLSASLRCPRELRQHVLASGGPVAPEAPHFLETECRVKVKRGDVIRPGHELEHCIRTGEGPAQAGTRQLGGDTRRRHARSTRTLSRSNIRLRPDLGVSAAVRAFGLGSSR